MRYIIGIRPVGTNGLLFFFIELPGTESKKIMHIVHY